MRLKFGSTILDAAGTTSTVLGTAMSSLRLWMDSNPLTSDEPADFVSVSESEDAIVIRFFLTYEAADVATLKTNAALIARAIKDPPGTAVVLESVSGTTLREWSQASQDYLAATGEVNIYYASTTIAAFECVVSLTQTPFKASSGGDTALGTEGRMGPHVASVTRDAFGMQTITLAAAFAPLANGTDARTNAATWLAAIQSRTAPGLSWLPGVADLRTVGTDVSGRETFDSKMLGTVDATVTLRQVPPDLNTLDAAFRALQCNVLVEPRRLGYRVGAAITPGYEVTVEGQLEFTAVANQASAIPADGTITAAIASVVNATLDRIPSTQSSFIALTLSRTVSADTGRVGFRVTGIMGADETATRTISYSETITETNEPVVDVVADWEGGDVAYIAPGHDRRVVAHDVSWVVRGNIPDYQAPIVGGGLNATFLRLTFSTTSFNPDKFENPSSGATGLTDAGEMNAVRYSATYREIRRSASASAGGRVVIVGSR